MLIDPGSDRAVRSAQNRSNSGVVAHVCCLSILLALVLTFPAGADRLESHEARIDALVETMTIEEKVGQMTLRGRSSRSTDDPNLLEGEVRSGRIGLMLNIMEKNVADRLQQVATEESRLGIPILFGRDVIHGFRTIFPIPLAQAASFDMELVEAAARASAEEATTYGIRWTFAPMADIARDPRWGRIAESPGEDPYLGERLAVAMVRGFQTDDLARPTSLAACVKHFAAYGAAVGGRDYAGAHVPRALLHNLYLRPFQAAVDAGAATLMTGFHEIDGVPATADVYLLRDVLRDDWGFRGFVVSDWNSVTEMIAHGVAGGPRDAARLASVAGVDVEMTSRVFQDHLPELVASGVVDEAVLDDAVRHVLRVKLALGLFERPERDATRDDVVLSEPHLDLARDFARKSTVLLKNDGSLPLADDATVAVVGPLADAPHEQLGTWTFDGQAEDSRTPVAALRQRLGDESVRFAAGLPYSRSRDRSGFDEALAAARASDVVFFFGGEEAILSGEAHSRADLRLPGLQEELFLELADTGKPLVLVLMSGRPNTLEAILDAADAILAAWHPGTMAGPALADLLTGDVSPSGRLPVSWPRTVGQVPIYYNHKSTGRPAPDEVLAFDDIPIGAWQSSLSNTSRYLDLDKSAQFPFGHGLTYSTFEYADLEVSQGEITASDEIAVSVQLTNSGRHAATEVVQLYVRDVVASLSRPVRELKGFQQVELAPGESRRVTFRLSATDLAFFDETGASRLEPGEFHVWIGPDAESGPQGKFELAEGNRP